MSNLRPDSKPEAGSPKARVKLDSPNVGPDPGSVELTLFKCSPFFCRHLTHRTAIETKEKSLLDWLLQKHPGTPRTRAKQWILAGRVSVTGQIIRKSHQMLSDPGAGLQLLDRRASTLACESGWIIHPRVSLLYLDAFLAVVNKGPGLISVPAPNCDISALSILADFLAGRLKARERGAAGRTLPPAYRKLQPLPVHRLDQYTSGVFCIAMNPTARGYLIEQLKERSMRREYVAFVEGRPASAQGTWRQWLELSADELRQHVVSEAHARSGQSEAQEAITRYEVIAEFPLADGKSFVSKLRLKLETGRKHQIRVQAANAGLPLIGDRTYNPNYRRSTDGTLLIPFPRQALHAETLTLIHPAIPGKEMTWRAEMPKDLRHLEASLRSMTRKA